MGHSPNLFVNTMSAAMSQFDVFANPIIAARRAYPLVVVLQSDFAQDVREQIVAPLVPSQSMPKAVSRLTPIVVVNGAKHVVLVPALTGVRSRDLPERLGSIASARSELLAAVDYLFFGV
jgi:toxin CcdB